MNASNYTQEMIIDILYVNSLPLVVFLMPVVVARTTFKHGLQKLHGYLISI